MKLTQITLNAHSYADVSGLPGGTHQRNIPANVVEILEFDERLRMVHMVDKSGKTRLIPMEALTMLYPVEGEYRKPQPPAQNQQGQRR